MVQIVSVNWVPDAEAEEPTGEYPMYMAYYECHDIDWKLPEQKAVYRSTDNEIHVSIVNGGEIAVPELALVPDVQPRSSGLQAKLGRLDTNTQLDPEALFIGVGVKVSDTSPDSILSAINRAAKIAATCAVALGQAFGVRKVAEYTALISEDGTKRPINYLYSFRSPGPAVFDEQTRDELSIALTNLESSEDIHIEAAIGRYESSKRMSVEADRILSLWMSAERLARGVKERMSEWFHSVEPFSCGANDEQHSHGSLNFDFYSDLRNRIVHRGLTSVDPPWTAQGLLVSRAQLLDAYCSEGIRLALGMSPTGEVHRQLEIAAENPRAREQLVM